MVLVMSCFYNLYTSRLAFLTVADKDKQFETVLSSVIFRVNKLFSLKDLQPGPARGGFRGTLHLSPGGPMH